MPYSHNLGISREFKPSKLGHRMSKAYAVGVDAEWTKERSASYGKGNKIELGGLFGAAKNLRSFSENGTDLIEVEIDYGAGPRVPKSYGGVSGGALWEMHVELDESLKNVKVNKRLHGVALRQSVDRRRITSNGIASIETIVKRIEAEVAKS